MSDPLIAPLTLTIADRARARFHGRESGPFLRVDWDDTVLLHFAIAPEKVIPHLPRGVELELHDGQACLSVVALTMRRFRPIRRFSFAWLFRPLPPQQFLNFRTYVRAGDEPGAYFLAGWLSRPLGLSAPLSTVGLPAKFAEFHYHNADEKVEGTVRRAHSEFRYSGTKLAQTFKVCAAESLAEFALERYTGFFCRRGKPKIFRINHPAWTQVPVEVRIADRSLIVRKFPWFEQARLAGAHLARGIEEVEIGLPHRWCKTRSSKHGLSAFYQMP